LAEATEDLSQFQQIVIMRVRNMTAIDATGLHAMETLAARLRKTGREVLVCGARRQPRSMLMRGDFAQHIGPENILPHIQAALERARRIHTELGQASSPVH
jgi:SulP family sulfate permease